MRSTRRQFLQTAAATSLIAALPTAALATNPRKPAPEILLGLASYSLRNSTRAQLIQQLKQIDIARLNAKDVKDHLPSTSAQETEAAAADYTANAIRLTAAGVVYFDKDTDSDVQAKFDYARTANVPIIVAGPSPAVLPRVEKFVKLYNIRIAIHNHGPEDKLWPSPLDVLASIKNLDPRIGCCIDVGHTARCGVSVVRAIHAVDARLFDVHIKDLADLRDKESQVAVGDGKMPVPEIFRALRQIQYRGGVDLEYEIHPDDPMPGILKSLAYMRGVLAGQQSSA